MNSGHIVDDLYLDGVAAEVARKLKGLSRDEIYSYRHLLLVDEISAAVVLHIVALAIEATPVETWQKSARSAAASMYDGGTDRDKLVEDTLMLTFAGIADNILSQVMV